MALTGIRADTMSNNSRKAQNHAIARQGGTRVPLKANSF